MNANGDLLGYNMFAYCGNNPVMYSDPTGEFAIETVFGAIVFSTVVGALLGATLSTVDTLMFNEDPTWQEVVGSAVSGMISGGLMGGATAAMTLAGGGLSYGAVVLYHAIAGSVGSFIGSLTESAISGEDMSTWEVYIRAGVDSVWGGVSGAIAGLTIGALPKLKGKQLTKAIKRIVSRIQLPSTIVEGVLGSLNDFLIRNGVEFECKNIVDMFGE